MKKITIILKIHPILSTTSFNEKTGHCAHTCFKKKKKVRTEKTSDKCKERNRKNEKMKASQPVRAVQSTSDSDSNEFISILWMLKELRQSK